MTPHNTTRLRCQLSVPASSEKMLLKAAGLQVDGIILDLEDGVAPNAKIVARATLCAALRDIDFGDKHLCVRVNAIETGLCVDDLRYVMEHAHGRFHCFLLPKINDARDIAFIDHLLGHLERDHAPSAAHGLMGIDSQIETAMALTNINAIASATPRMRALTIGPGDLAADLGIRLSAGDKDANHLWQYHRTLVAIAARSHNLRAIDGPYFPLDGNDGLAGNANAARDCGMHGKWAIHPRQIATIQEAFSPSEAEIAEATAIIAAFEQGKAKGLGAIAYQGKMIDEALIKMCNATLTGR